MRGPVTVSDRKSWEVAASALERLEDMVSVGTEGAEVGERDGIVL